ncbi:MAG: hypothetical protein C4617_00485 [Candidatus Liberibacter europaeus]|uniref:GcrA cell cycle regulator n=1 Tax=Candidatus Liberibacter europaeus TaxID=744859 RepID=A0A2T4VYS9_9HYPH|nr:hypothetical protein [Candidatus Liberibacter europaeus]PTL86934.1 MAG: hypothetical protein C4617_00485 [Candidatus Liberibacter europaeus]
MSWTDERIDKLKKFWSEGLSARQIAIQLGGVTRNAVIGKVHRLFLSGRVKVDEKKQSLPDRGGVKSKGRSSKVRRSMTVCISKSGSRNHGSIANSKQKSRSVPKDDVDPCIVLPISRCLRLTELTDRTCKWPLEDSFGKDFSFCGSDVNNDSPYCDYHKRLAYQRGQDRRKVRANAK